MRGAIAAVSSIALAALVGCTQPAAKVSQADHAAQSHTCLTTGSNITLKSGQCANAFGNVYTQDDLQKTGRTTAAGALSQLDPAVTITH